MIDICIALNQSVSPHTGVRAIQNTGVFLQAVFQTPRPHSFFLDRGSAAKTLITQYTIPPAAQANYHRTTNFLTRDENGNATVAFIKKKNGLVHLCIYL